MPPRQEYHSPAPQFVQDRSVARASAEVGAPESCACRISRSGPRPAKALWMGAESDVAAKLAAMGLRLLYRAVRRGLELVVLRFRAVEANDVEIVVLRHQIAVLRRQVGPPPFDHADRALLAAPASVLPRPRRGGL